jgi:hypothetical protein
MARLYGATDLEGGPEQMTSINISNNSKQNIYILLVASLAMLGLVSTALYSGA